MELFYSSDVQISQLCLHADEAIHCIKALRKNIGDILHVTDGKGSYYQAEIIDIDKTKNKVKATIQKQETYIQATKIGLCIAPTKNIDRMEWLVEKAVELGVCEIQWVITQHSYRKNIALERMQRIAVAAMKQSVQYFLPILHDIQPFLHWLESQNVIQGSIGYCGDIKKQSLDTIVLPSHEVTYWICIGPEGDFTQNEVQQAIQKGLVPISIGKHRLRTETAALTALSYLYLLSEYAFNRS